MIYIKLIKNENFKILTEYRKRRYLDLVSLGEQYHVQYEKHRSWTRFDIGEYLRNFKVF